MTRWIVFDEATAQKLGARAERSSDHAADVFVAACSHSRNAIAILPGRAPDSAVLLSVSRPAAGVARYEATGLLGLNDMLISPEEETPKKWWQKLLE